MLHKNMVLIHQLEFNKSEGDELRTSKRIWFLSPSTKKIDTLQKNMDSFPCVNIWWCNREIDEKKWMDSLYVVSILCVFSYV